MQPSRQFRQRAFDRRQTHGEFALLDVGQVNPGQEAEEDVIRRPRVLAVAFYKGEVGVSLRAMSRNMSAISHSMQRNSNPAVAHPFDDPAGMPCPDPTRRGAERQAEPP